MYAADLRKTNWINALEYGLKNDGSAGIYAKLSEILVDGNSVYFPRGVYLVDHYITIPKNTQIKGDNAVFLIASDATDYYSAFLLTEYAYSAEATDISDDIVIEGITFKAQARVETTIRNYLRIRNTRNFLMKNCVFDMEEGNCLQPFEVYGGNFDTRFEGVLFRDYQNTSYGGGVCIYTYGASKNVIFSNCDFHKKNQDEMVFVNINAGNMDNLRFDDCRFFTYSGGTCPDYCLSMKDSADYRCTMSFNNCSLNTQSYNHGAFIYGIFNDNSTLTFNGCHFCLNNDKMNTAAVNKNVSAAASQKCVFSNCRFEVNLPYVTGQYISCFRYATLIGCYVHIVAADRAFDTCSVQHNRIIVDAINILCKDSDVFSNNDVIATTISQMAFQNVLSIAFCRLLLTSCAHFLSNYNTAAGITRIVNNSVTVSNASLYNASTYKVLLQGNAFSARVSLTGANVIMVQNTYAALTDGATTTVKEANVAVTY